MSAAAVCGEVNDPSTVRCKIQLAWLHTLALRVLSLLFS